MRSINPTPTKLNFFLFLEGNVNLETKLFCKPLIFDPNGCFHFFLPNMGLYYKICDFFFISTSLIFKRIVSFKLFFFTQSYSQSLNPLASLSPRNNKKDKLIKTMSDHQTYVFSSFASLVVVHACTFAADDGFCLCESSEQQQPYRTEDVQMPVLLVKVLLVEDTRRTP